jgi:hypothetical protein
MKSAWILIGDDAWEAYYEVQKQEMPDKEFAVLFYVKKNSSFIHRGELFDLEPMLDITVEKIEEQLIEIYNERI